MPESCGNELVFHSVGASFLCIAAYKKTEKKTFMLIHYQISKQYVEEDL